jgi:Fe2+ transport system protein FeoA
VLRGVRGPRDQARRLLELGFVPGTMLRVVTRGATGGLVVAAGSARIAVDAAVAALLLVVPAAPGGAA